MTWSVTDIPWPMFNAGVAAPDARFEAVQAALEELRERGLPWFWFALPQTPPAIVDLVESAGAAPFDQRAPWMEVERTRLPAAPSPPGAVIQEALDEADVRTWAGALQDAYGFPDAGRDGWIEAALRRDPSHPQFRLWTVLKGEGAVANTLGFVADGIIGQFGVGVVPGERRRGYGRLVTLLPAEALGAPVVGHWATEDGQRLYATLGMTVDGWVTRYLGGMAEIPATAAGGHSGG